MFSFTVKNQQDSFFAFSWKLFKKLNSKCHILIVDACRFLYSEVINRTVTLAIIMDPQKFKIAL